MVRFSYYIYPCFDTVKSKATSDCCGSGIFSTVPFFLSTLWIVLNAGSGLVFRVWFKDSGAAAPDAVIIWHG